VSETLSHLIWPGNSMSRTKTVTLDFCQDFIFLLQKGLI